MSREYCLGPVTRAEKAEEKLHRLEQAASVVIAARVPLPSGGSFLPDNPSTRAKLDTLSQIIWGHRG